MNCANLWHWDFQIIRDCLKKYLDRGFLLECHIEKATIDQTQCYYSSKQKTDNHSETDAIRGRI